MYGGSHHIPSVAGGGLRGGGWSFGSSPRFHIPEGNRGCGIGEAGEVSVLRKGDQYFSALAEMQKSSLTLHPLPSLAQVSETVPMPALSFLLHFVLTRFISTILL